MEYIDKYTSVYILHSSASDSFLCKKFRRQTDNWILSNSLKDGSYAIL